MLRLFEPSRPPAEDTIPTGSFAGDLRSIVSISILIALAFGVVHCLISRLLRHLLPAARDISTAARSDLLLQVIWLLGCSPLPVMYAVAVYELHSTPLLRWRGCSAVGEAAFLLHVGSSLYECATYIYHGKPWVYMIHHAIVVYCYVGVLYIGGLHFWFAWAGLVEATNIHVCFLKICLILNVCRHSLAEAVNGGCLYVTYLLLRLVSLPCAVAGYAYDAHRLPLNTWQWAWHAGPATRALAASAPICSLVIWAMSCVWFAPIHKGMMKVLKGDDPTPTQEELDEHMMKGSKPRSGAQPAGEMGSHVAQTPSQNEELHNRSRSK